MKDMNPHLQTRRTFLKQTTAAIGVAATGLPQLGRAAEARNAQGNTPWYGRALRWGQTNITEIDPERYDIPWWRGYWKRTRTQGVIINAGGIVAYYPSKFPLQYRARALHGRDLYGDLTRAAHEDGLAVLARMDSNRAHEDFYRAHPEWFAVDENGRPYRAGDLYISCINSPYYGEYIPGVLREIIERTHPEGITDNSWSGLGRNSICHCRYCQDDFKKKTGENLPGRKDWDDSVYRQWIQWNYARRLEVWDLNNRTTRDAGGPDCLWIGMNSGSVTGQSHSFRDYKEICRRAEIIMLDHQTRSDAGGFQENGESGALIHGLLGWNKLIPESMAMYQAGRPTFRLASKPAPEARLWMLDGFAGGIQPWWHHVGAYHEDRRMYRTAGPVLRWHEKNQRYLINRQPVATIGLAWSQTNTDFYGRDDAGTLVDQPWRGLSNALIKARLPFLPVHLDHLDRDASKFAVLVLPNLAALSDAQVESIRRFVSNGGGLVATGDATRCNEWGEPRPDFALADLFGAHVAQGKPASVDAEKRRWASGTVHSYLRLLPELRASVDGPHIEGEPPAHGKRHPVLAGFDETDILPFGGRLEPLRLDPSAQVPATFIPAFPIYPPETAWMREPQTDIPALVLNESRDHGRVAYLPADLDRRFDRDNLPDHARLLDNLVRWAARDEMPCVIDGPGLIDGHLYRQEDHLVLHLVNLTSAGTWRAPVDELIPVGPLQVKLKLPPGVPGDPARMLVSGKPTPTRVDAGWTTFSVPSVLDHEVVVIGEKG